MVRTVSCYGNMVFKKAESLPGLWFHLLILLFNVTIIRPGAPKLLLVLKPKKR